MPIKRVYIDLVGIAALAVFLAYLLAPLFS